MREPAHSIEVGECSVSPLATDALRHVTRPPRRGEGAAPRRHGVETVLTNAWLVLPNEVRRGSLVIRGGKIAAIDSTPSRRPSAIDLEGDLLLPGLVDLHTDNLERHLQPRPGVAWPDIAALVTHDRQMAAAGITTVFDSLCVGDQFEGRSGRDEALTKAITAMETAQRDGLLKSEHVLHLRCEVSSLGAAAAFASHIDHPLVRLASLMDHTPGQRQWRRLDKWLQVAGSRLCHGDDAQTVLARRQVQQRACAVTARHEVASLARARRVILASHDDTTEAHVAEAVGLGVTISEFPTTRQAAEAARVHGLSVIMGAPNVVLGGSHSGNISARELAGSGLVDALASDYVPDSLLQAAFRLCDAHDLPLPRAIGMVSATPAAMVGLDDRGEIAAGKRADLIWVKPYHHMPVVRASWCQGRQIT